MIALVQRVSQGCVMVNETVHAKIGNGYVVLVGIQNDDTFDDVCSVASKIVHLRIMPDEKGKMNHSILETHGEILLVSQFTLCARVKKGRRPTFVDAMESSKSQTVFNQLEKEIQSYGISLKTGIFGEKMNVTILNEGPTTIILDSNEI